MLTRLFRRVLIRGAQPGPVAGLEPDGGPAGRDPVQVVVGEDEGVRAGHVDHQRLRALLHGGGPSGQAGALSAGARRSAQAQRRGGSYISGRC